MDEKQIKVAQIGLTTRCNGACKYCARNVRKFSIRDLDPKIVYKLPLKTAKKVFFSGLAGDPIFYEHLIPVIKYIKKENPDIKITIATNGSIHSVYWWKDLAKLLNYPENHIYFGIDGLEDTHKIHRGTDFYKIIKNLEAFISAGGKAIWQTIAFKYNEHQIEECQKLAKKIGAMFILKMSRQYEKEGPFSKPNLVKYEGREDMCKNIEGDPYCFYADRKEIWLEADGYLHPCCFMCARFFATEIDEMKVPFQLLLNYRRERELTNLNTHSFQNALNSSYFKYIEENYKKLDLCNTTCRVFWSDMIANLPDDWETPSKYESFN